MQRKLRFLSGFVCVVLVARGIVGAVGRNATSIAQQNPKTVETPLDLSEYKTVATATPATLKPIQATVVGQPGYLGISVTPDTKGRLVVSEVEAGSPAANAGLQRGDLLLKAAGKAVRSQEDLREGLHSQAPGAKITLQVEHRQKPLEVEVALGALSRPLHLGADRALLGVQIAEGTDEGARVTRVQRGSPGEAAGVRAGDLLVKVDGVAVTEALRLDDTVAEKRPGQEMVLTLRRAAEDIEVRATLAAAPDTTGRQLDPGNDRRPRFARDVYRLAVVPIEYADVKHNPMIKSSDWNESLYSKGTYTGKMSVTGQTVYGSLNDYYLEQSSEKFHVEGRCFDWVEVGKNRADYSQGTGVGVGGNALLTEAMDRLLAREGAAALNGYDGVLFLYAGARFPTNRGGIYWPHRSTVAYRGKRWAYFIVPEGGPRMTNISVICHEFGHMLGLPDLYARPENPGSEGLGNWCVMSNQIGNGRPQHMSAWCKQEMGWLTPTVIDPTVRQKLLLAPVEQSSKECYKVLLRPDGSEYLLLENRRKSGFDTGLPAEGLLIWRVVGNRPILEEAHGVEGPSGPRVYPRSVPFPSPQNTAYTPFTTPSSRSQLGGGLPVYLTNIQKLPDGRIAFYVGYTFD